MIIDRTIKGHFVANLHDYLCDTVGEVTELPKMATTNPPIAMGSRAEVIEDGSKYILNGNDEWVPDAASGGAGGGTVVVTWDDVKVTLEGQEQSEDGTTNYTVKQGEEVVAEIPVPNVRYFNGTLQYKDGEEWKPISARNLLI